MFGFHGGAIFKVDIRIGLFDSTAFIRLFHWPIHHFPGRLALKLHLHNSFDNDEEDYQNQNLLCELKL